MRRGLHLEELSSGRCRNRFEAGGIEFPPGHESLDGNQRKLLRKAASPLRIFSPTIRVDCTLVDIEQGDVVIEDLVKQDDELHEVGVGLLPERFLLLPNRLSGAMRYRKRERTRRGHC